MDKQNYIIQVAKFLLRMQSHGYKFTLLRSKLGTYFARNFNLFRG